MAVMVTQMIAGIRTANIVHLVFSFIDPIYGFVGTYNQIAQVKNKISNKNQFLVSSVNQGNP